MPATSYCRYCGAEVADSKLAAHLQQFHADRLKKERKRK